MSTKLIGITGGIGCGKSTVCRILTVMGFPIYDCDSEARRIMNRDKDLLESLAYLIGNEPFKHNTNTGLREVNRALLAEIVFNDSAKLELLNRAVHKAVREDIAFQLTRHEQRTEPLFFVETAILMESKIYNMVDAVWNVEAPYEKRISRAMQRDNASRQAIEARIRNQKPVPYPAVISDSGKRIPVDLICNDDTTSLLPQIFRLLKREKIDLRLIQNVL